MGNACCNSNETPNVNVELKPELTTNIKLQYDQDHNQENIQNPHISPQQELMHFTEEEVEQHFTTIKTLKTNKLSNSNVTSQASFNRNESYFQQRETKPQILLSTGGLYQGEWIADIRDGFGILIFNKTKYQGQFRNNKAHGKGIITFENGDSYEGDFKNDKLCGFGVYTYQNGCKYSGNWRNDKQNGLGKEYFLNGAFYEGYYKDGDKNGYGKYVWKDDNFYEGEWKNNFIHGYGKYQYQESVYYQGQWQNNVRHGKGVQIYPNGDIFSGYFVNDKKHGTGSMKYKDGTVEEQEWASGKMGGVIKEDAELNLTNRLNISNRKE